MTCFKDNRAICQKIFDNLTPGGYFELQDPCFPVFCDDGTLTGTALDESVSQSLSKTNLSLTSPFASCFCHSLRWSVLQIEIDTDMTRWSTLLVSSMAMIGRNLAGSEDWATYMREVGFEDVTEKRFYVPINPWARGKNNKLLGALACQNLSEGVASMSTAAFTRILGWTSEKLEVFLVGVRKDLRNKAIHGYIKTYFVWGRKPGAVTVEVVAKEELDSVDVWGWMGTVLAAVLRVDVFHQISRMIYKCISLFFYIKNKNNQDITF